MRSDVVQPKSSRRCEAICHAADLLREGGPSALTSVAVAGRMGITQSAVYRHVTDMDELSALAAELVVSELIDALHNLVLDPNVDWEQVDDVRRLCRSLIDSAVDNSSSFAVADQWRFVDGPLGEGIRTMITEGYDLIGSLIELRWRAEFGGEIKIATKGRSTIAVHARAIHEDGQAIARLVRDVDCSFTHEELTDILRHRIIAGWAEVEGDFHGIAAGGGGEFGSGDGGGEFLKGFRDEVRVGLPWSDPGFSGETGRVVACQPGEGGGEGGDFSLRIRRRGEGDGKMDFPLVAEAGKLTSHEALGSGVLDFPDRPALGQFGFD